MLFPFLLTLVAIQDEGNEAASAGCNRECKTKSQYEFMLKRDIGTETFQFLNDLIYTESNLKNLPNKSLKVFK